MDCELRDYDPPSMLGRAGFMPISQWQRGKITGTEGVDFVTGHICGDRRRVVSVVICQSMTPDRATCMEKYELSPDELVEKAFRVIQSGRAAYGKYVRQSSRKPKPLPEPFREKRLTIGIRWWSQRESNPCSRRERPVS